MNTPYTIASAPPVKAERTQKRSRWVELFTEARKYPGEWRRMVEPMKKSTASQVASDIRNAHTRDLAKTRMRGLLPTDQWDAAWGNDASDPNTDNYYVWMRYMGPPVGDDGATLVRRRRKISS